MHPISNVEFILLQLVAECRQASGYDIMKMVDHRGYREWANIGTTSIYAGLKKLSNKGWIASGESDRKSGKGPVPTQFALTETGMIRLKNEIVDSLSSTRERDIRFDLGLAALPLIGKDEAIAALRERLDFLRTATTEIRQKYEAQGAQLLPLNVRTLFLHPIVLIECERTFVSKLINELLGDLGEYGEDH
ncbi:PadR family transcriptional regulator [Cohnella cholangitidis]|uniref:PadR family transcriptional regulator n=1 Tax=Cohnella cholangitidis TaxID=2598458 RepID=A0A7G5BW27_9BACL|nr:PadR family transcriptional regulator [Cohnella cholangitidis]QMV41161.1 PadR family transcriptional regulator [Cohnella cholangitidis]